MRILTTFLYCLASGGLSGCSLQPAEDLADGLESSAEQASTCSVDPAFHACLPSVGDSDVVCQALCAPVAYCGECRFVAEAVCPDSNAFRGRWVSDRGRTSDCPQIRTCPIGPFPINTAPTHFCMEGRPL